MHDCTSPQIPQIKTLMSKKNPDTETILRIFTTTDFLKYTSCHLREYLCCNSCWSLRDEKSANSWTDTSALYCWLWKWGEPVSRISAPFAFPVFSYPFLDRFFHLQHADFNGKHLSYLNKTNWPEAYAFLAVVLIGSIPLSHQLWQIRFTTRRKDMRKLRKL